MVGIASNIAKKEMIESLLTGKTVHAVLLANTYTQNPDHNTYSSSVAHEAVEQLANGEYNAGGVAVSSVTFTQDDSLDRGKVTFSAIDLNPVTFTNVRYIQLIYGTGTVSTAWKIFGTYDIGNQSVTNGPFTWTPHSSGAAYLQAAS